MRPRGCPHTEGLNNPIGHRRFSTGAHTALTDTKPQRSPARERPYQCADDGGLYVEVQATGKNVWRMQYRLGGRDARKERVTLGSLTAAWGIAACRH
jgi:hypothetical protein